jgi:hypothetical protein
MVSFSGYNYNSVKFGMRAEQARTNGWERGLNYDEEAARRKTGLIALVKQHPRETDERLMQEANKTLSHWRFPPITVDDIFAVKLAPPSPKLEQSPKQKPVILKSDSEDEELRPSKRKRKKAVVASEDEDEFPVKHLTTSVNKPTNPFINEDSDSELPKSSPGRLKRGRRTPVPSVKKDELVPSDAQTLMPHRTHLMLSSSQQKLYEQFLEDIEQGNRKAIKETLKIHPTFLRQPDSEGIPPVIAVIHSSQPELLKEFLAHPDITLQSMKAGGYTPAMWPDINPASGRTGIRQFIDTHKVLLEYHQENPTHWDYGTIASGKYPTDYIDEAVKKSKLKPTVNEKIEIADLKARIQVAQNSLVF